MKQKNAFPPNFVHSLDSTHMLLTALHCQRCEPIDMFKNEMNSTWIALNSVVL